MQSPHILIEPLTYPILLFPRPFFPIDILRGSYLMSNLMISKREIRCSIYVSGIPLIATYHMVRSRFKEFGEVKRVYVNGDGISLYAFIAFKLPGSADAVLSARDSIHVGGQKVTIKKRLMPSRSKAWKDKQSAKEPPARVATTENGPWQKHRAQERFTLQEISSPIHLRADVHDSLASKFIPLPPTQTAPETEGILENHEVPTLMYSNNGELIVGELSKPDTAKKDTHPAQGGRVLRVDGVPMNWSAARLYQELRDSKFPVTATLVYDDIDSRNLRQGLVQVETAAEAAELALKMEIYTSKVHLTVLISTVLSIGPMRRNYSGRFTAYNRLEDPEKYSYSVAEPFEPRSDAQVSAGMSERFNLSSLNLSQIPPSPMVGVPYVPPPPMANPCSAFPNTQLWQPAHSRAEFLSLEPSHHHQAIGSVSVEQASGNMPAIKASAKSPLGSFTESCISSPLTSASPMSQVSPDSIASPTDGTDYFKTSSTQVHAPGNRQNNITVNSSYYGPGSLQTCFRNTSIYSKHSGCSGNLQLPSKDSVPRKDEEKMKQNSYLESLTAHSQIMTTDQYCNAGSIRTQAFLPITLPHKASQTLIVDNFWPEHVQDAESLANSMAVFGEVLVADLVPISSSQTRAYIFFSSPASAELALCRLGMCDSGENRLQVRLG